MIDFIAPADKKEIVENNLNNARPLVIASCKDGIVFVGENPSIVRKTAEVYDKIAAGTIGMLTNIYELIEMLVKVAIDYGSSYSRKDVHVERLTIVLANILYNIYSDPRLIPYSAEVVLAQIEDSPEDDKILIVDYTGGIENLERQPYIVIGRNTEPLKKKINQLLNDTKFQILFVKDAIEIIKQAISIGKKEKNNLSDALKFEVCVLERENHHKRRFKRLEGEGV